MFPSGIMVRQLMKRRQTQHKTIEKYERVSIQEAEHYWPARNRESYCSFNTVKQEN